MLFQKTPTSFKPAFGAVGHLVQCAGVIILLHRQNHKPQGGTWGIPSGKIDGSEPPLTAAARETEEETGLLIPLNSISLFRTVYVRYPDYDFVYHLFHTVIAAKEKIQINPDEHQAAKWISPAEALSLPLIEDLDVCLKLFFAL